MIKEIFKDSEFSFRKWNQLFLCDAFFKETFKNDYINASNERKKAMLLKHAFNQRIPC